MATDATVIYGRNPEPTSATEPYSIDPARDRLLSLRRVVEWYTSRTGERLHRTVPYRWAQRGIGGIRLPTVRIGRARFTSEEALTWWTAAIDKNRRATT